MLNRTWIFGLLSSLNTELPRFLFTVASTLIAFLGISFAQDHSETSVFNYGTAIEVEGSYSQLIRSENTIAMELRTSGLNPKMPHTAWWVIFNSPEACSGVCNADDIFGEDGKMSLNEAANISILFADGAMSDAEGNGNFSALLTQDRPFGQVLAGPGLTDTQNAEVHLVIREHGELKPDLAYEQLSLGKSCADCYKKDVQFTIHLPTQVVADN